MADEDTTTTNTTDDSTPTVVDTQDTQPEEETSVDQSMEETADSNTPRDTTEMSEDQETTPEIAADSDDQGSQAETDPKPDEAVEESTPTPEVPAEPVVDSRGRWYVVHTFAGHENRVATTLRQRIEAEHLENQIFDILVPTQDKIEIRGGKKETVKEKIFPGYILVKMDLGDISWLAVRTTQGVTSFVGAGNKPTPISDREVASIVKFTTQGAAPTFKDVFMIDDTVKITDGPFAEFIGKVDSVDKERGRVRVLVSIFGRETPVELDFLQVQKL